MAIENFTGLSVEAIEEIRDAADVLISIAEGKLPQVAEANSEVFDWLNELGCEMYLFQILGAHFVAKVH
jgi:uncharacterized protein YlzI (FlbEa/FlbD family)